MPGWLGSLAFSELPRVPPHFQGPLLSCSPVPVTSFHLSALIVGQGRGHLCASSPSPTQLSSSVSSVQSLSHVQLFATPWTAACQAPLSITNSQSLLKLMSIESVMPSNHLILCHPLLLLPSTFPSIRVFSNESVLRIRWPKCCSFSFSISPSNEYSGLLAIRMDWLDLLAVQGEPSPPSSTFLSSVAWALSTMGSWGHSPGLCALQFQPTAHIGSPLLHTFNAPPPPRTCTAFKSGHAAHTSPLSTVPLPLPGHPAWLVFLPQDLCTCCTFYVEDCSPGRHKASICMSLRYYFLKQAFFLMLQLVRIPSKVGFSFTAMSFFISELLTRDCSLTVGLGD